MLSVSAEAQQAEQQKLIRMQQEGQALSAELSEKLALKQQSLLEDMMKSIREQLKDYNKDGRYKLILTKVGDNILYAEGALDITEDSSSTSTSTTTLAKASRLRRTLPLRSSIHPVGFIAQGTPHRGGAA